jgi:hypothetical protein
MPGCTIPFIRQQSPGTIGPGDLVDCYASGVQGRQPLAGVGGIPQSPLPFAAAGGEPDKTYPESR